MPCTPAPLTIVLATYNGAGYLGEQLESIRRQTFTDWQLLLRDDGSTDATRDIVREYAVRDPRIALIEDARGRMGVVGNFSALAETAQATTARYLAFADQDDVWHPEKLACQMECIQAAERDSAPATPIAVHTDLAVVDAALRSIHPSFLRYQGLWHEADRPLRTLLVQNFVTGCTLLINRPLLELALPIPQEALVHDWWLALCAGVAGRLEFLPQATVQYRQHGGNIIGAKRWLSPAFWPKLRQLANRGKTLRDTLFQADALRLRLSECSSIDVDALGLLDRYCRLGNEPVVWRRLREICRLPTRRQGHLRNVALLAQACLLEPEIARG